MYSTSYEPLADDGEDVRSGGVAVANLDYLFSAGWISSPVEI